MTKPDEQETVAGDLNEIHREIEALRQARKVETGVALVSHEFGESVDSAPKPRPSPPAPKQIASEATLIFPEDEFSMAPAAPLPKPRPPSIEADFRDYLEADEEEATDKERTPLHPTRRLDSLELAEVQSAVSRASIRSKTHRTMTSLSAGMLLISAAWIFFTALVGYGLSASAS